MGTRRTGTLAVDLSTSLGSVELPAPVVTASGTSGHGAELCAYGDLSALGAITVKSLMVDPWPGNPTPRVAPVEGGMLNSVGLQGPGVEAWMERDLPQLVATGARIVVSIWGRRVEDYAKAAERLRRAPSPVVAIELNVSCPNLEGGHTMFSHSASATVDVVKAAAVCGRPLWVKLAPGVADIVEIGAAALDAGAEALTLVNTLPAMAIDLEAARPLLGTGGGGLSGDALHAVALRAVADCRRALPEAGIVGVGGVSTPERAVAMLLAGADAVGVGTATLADPRAPWKVQAGIGEWCARHGITRVRDLTGRGSVP